MMLVPGTTEIDYDDIKDVINIEEHGYSLECAIDVLNEIMLFQGNYIISDEYFENGEDRFMILGDYNGETVLIACTMRNNGKQVRPFSMRTASKKERSILENNPSSFDISALLED